MQRPRRHFLAGAGFSHDQHVRIGGGDRPDPVAQIDHHLRATEEPGLQLVPPSGQRAQLTVFENEPAPVQRTPRDVCEMAGRERLLDEIVCSIAHRPDCELHVPMPRDQHHRDIRIDLADTTEQAHPVYAGHTNVTDHHAGELVGDEVEGRLAGYQLPHLEPSELERLCRGEAHILLIVDQQDAARYHGTGSSTVALAASSSISNTAPPSG